MPRHLLTLVALLALLCAPSLHAQQAPPPPLPDAPPVPAPQAEEGEHDARELLGTWMGVTMGGEELDEGDFVLTFKDDGTGSIMEGGDKEPEPFTYTYDPDTKRLVIFFDGDADDAFPIDMTFDGDTATFAPEDDDDVLVARRVQGEGDADDAGDAPADLSDSPLVGRWELVSFNGEPMPDDTRYVFHNHADGTGSSWVNGEPGYSYTWEHNFETGVATFTHPDQEPAAFTFDIEDGVATYVSTDGAMTIVERRIDDDEPADSGEGLVGTWVGLTMDGEELEEGEFVLVFNADGTGHFVEDHDDRERFTYTYDADARRCVLFFDGDADDAFPLDVTFDGDTATFTPENEDVLVARRVAEEGGDGDADHSDAPLVGAWEGVSQNGEPVDPDDTVRIVFHADGTGDLYEDGDDAEPFGWAYDAATEVCTITDDGDVIEFAVSIDGDTMTFESEDGEMFLVMRRIAGGEGDGDADDEDAMGDAGHPEGVLGSWYAQRNFGEWIPVDEEFRLEFRADGTAHAFENGEPEPDEITYSVDEDRRVIQIFDRDGDLEVEMEYDLFDDVLVLTFLIPEEYREDFELEEEEQMQMVLSRRPEGNAEHQRMRAEVEAGHPVNGESPRHRARKMQSMTQMRGIHQGLVTYSNSNREKYPDDLGVLLPGNYLTAEYLLTPWSEAEVPDDIDEWSDEEKAEWSLANTSYAFVLGGEKVGWDAEAVALFELPIVEGTETIAVCFEDNHVERMPYDEADDLIEAQTGRDLMGWMDHLGREQLPWDEGEAEGEHHDSEDHDHDHEEGHGHD